MYKRYLLLSSFVIYFLLFLSCQQNKLTADQIIHRSIEAHGGAAYDTLDLDFTFRKKNYNIKLNNGKYEYAKSWTDSSSSYLDVIDNKGFKRFKEGKHTKLSIKDSSVFANALNSVQYFALLPYGLHHDAVYPKLIGEQKVNTENYFLIRVSFSEKDGGEDFEDIFMYWINKSTFKVDYLAYKYNTNGGGARFREAYNRRNMKGIIIQDYKNYEAEKNAQLKSLGIKHQNDELKLLSKIELDLYDSIKP